MTEIRIGNQRLPTVLGDDGREYVTFVPDRDMDMVELLSDCLGKARFKKIQIEANNEATDFVVPQVYEGRLSGIFKDIKAINLELTDTENSKLWGKIRLTSHGLLQEYHRDRISTEIVASAEGIREAFERADRGLASTMTRTAEGLQATLADTASGLRAELTQTAQGLRRAFENDLTGLRSSQQATASGLSQEVRNREGAVSQLRQTLDTIGQQVTSAEGNYSQLLQRSMGIEQRVSNAEGSIRSNFTQLKDLIDQRVTREGVTSIINQSGDAIKLAIQRSGGIDSKMTGDEIISAVNLSRRGVRISGANITLDGDTLINGTFTTKIGEAMRFRADQIIAGTLDAGRINVINLNASSIVGLDASFIQARIEHAITSLLEGKVIRARNGAMLIDLNNARIDFNRNATINFNSANNALVRRKGTHTAFVHFNDVSSSADSGVGSLYASIGVTSSGDGINSQSSGRFCGARFFRGARGYEHAATVDQAELYGDYIILKDGFGGNRGFRFQPTTIDKMIDMGYLVSAVRALGRCWLHMNNVRWNPQNNNFGTAVINEYNNHIKDL